MNGVHYELQMHIRRWRMNLCRVDMWKSCSAAAIVILLKLAELASFDVLCAQIAIF